MTTTPDAQSASLEIPDEVRAAGYDALLQARDHGLELPQAYACALAAIEIDLMPVVRAAQAAELRRIAQGWSALGLTIPMHSILDRLRARADQLDPRETAEQLRARARDLYRRSDNVPLGRDAHATGAIDRLGELRDEADALMRRADELDGAAR